MTGLLTGISGAFPRRLLIGTLLPVTVFVLASAVLLEPLVPERWGSAEAWGVLGAGWRVELGTLAAVLLTGLLYVLNIPLIQLYEGYPWCESWLGRALIRRHRKRLRWVRDRERFLGELVRALKARDPQDSRLGEVRSERDSASRERVESNPKEGSLLPTRLGNAIRAFENYPERQYGMSGIDLWPRLTAVLPDSVATSIDSAKTRFDFTINASFLAAWMAALALLVALFAPVEPGAHVPWPLWWALGGAVLSVILYRSSVDRARSWGQLVKTAFDLHRRDLLEALGLCHEPADLNRERDLWREVTWQLAYLDPWDGKPPTLSFQPPSAPSQPHAVAAEGGGGLELSRGVREVDGRRLEVTLAVENTGSDAVTDLEVVDFLRPGWEYVWESAGGGRGGTRVRGVDPLRFAVRRLGAGKSLELTYKTIRRKAETTREETA